MNYQNIHDKIIFRAKIQNRKKLKHNDISYVYYEAHHILPKCIYPEYKNFKLYPWNMVLLTAKEHFIIHLLLMKIYPNNASISRSAWMMRVSNKYQKKRIHGKLYQKLKESLYNKKRSATHCKNLSLATKGIKKSPEKRKNMYSRRKGKTYEEIYGLEKAKELKNKKRLARLGKTSPIKGKPNPKVSAYRSRAVHCNELNMNFKSGIEAAIYVGLKSSADINKVAQGKLKSSGGYTWKYI